MKVICFMHLKKNVPKELRALPAKLELRAASIATLTLTTLCLQRCEKSDKNQTAVFVAYQTK